MPAALEVVLAQVAQRVRAVERLAQQQVRQPAVVLDELLLGRLLRRDRRDGLRAVVVGVPGTADDGDRGVAVEAEAAELLVEAQAVVLEVEQQRLVERAALERRRGRRHLQPREGLAFELEAHDLDGAQGLGPAVRLDGRSSTVRAFACESSARDSVLAAAATVAAATRMAANGGTQHGGSPWKLARTLCPLKRALQLRCAGPCAAVARTPG